MLYPMSYMLYPISYMFHITSYMLCTWSELLISKGYMPNEPNTHSMECTCHKQPATVSSLRSPNRRHPSFKMAAAIAQDMHDDFEFPADQLRQLLGTLQDENDAERSRLAKRIQNPSYSYGCSMCVNRVFQSKARLIKHIHADHGGDHCCPSSVQLRIVKAGWVQIGAVKCGSWLLDTDADIPATLKLLRWSATTLRQM